MLSPPRRAEAAQGAPRFGNFVSGAGLIALDQECRSSAHTPPKRERPSRGPLRAIVSRDPLTRTPSRHSTRRCHSARIRRIVGPGIPAILAIHNHDGPTLHQAGGDNTKMAEPTAPQREPESNQAERRRWNDPVWVARWLSRQALTSEVSGYLLDGLAPADGERILEIGSGTGRATLVLAAAIPGGAVTGADISRPLSELAGQRAKEQGVANVSFVVADVQHDDIPGGPFDAAASQFGVMFFDEPVRAFANIRRHVIPGGHLVFSAGGRRPGIPDDRGEPSSVLAASRRAAAREAAPWTVQPGGPRGDPGPASRRRAGKTWPAGTMT